MPELLTIDFEASCLPKHGRSFPIEVALADPTGQVRSWLIRPHASWRGWTWTAEAEALHGITFDELERNGLPAWQVAVELAAAAAGCRVLADSLLDAVWLQTLCSAGNVRPSFRVEQIGALADELGSGPEEVQRAIGAADRAVPGRHRAALDAAWLAHIAASLKEAAMRRQEDRPIFAWAIPKRVAAQGKPQVGSGPMPIGTR